MSFIIRRSKMTTEDHDNPFEELSSEDLQASLEEDIANLELSSSENNEEEPFDEANQLEVEGDDDYDSGGDFDDSNTDDDTSNNVEKNSDIELLKQELASVREANELDKLSNQVSQVTSNLSSALDKINKADRDLSSLNSRMNSASSVPEGMKIMQDINNVNIQKAKLVSMAEQMRTFVMETGKTIESRKNGNIQQTSEAENTYAKEWIKSNPAFIPKGMDEFSDNVRKLSAKLAEEGYDPRKPVHFKELTRRLTRKYPEKFRAKQDRSGGAFKSGKSETVAGNNSSLGGSGSGARNKMEGIMLKHAKEAGIPMTPENRNDLLKEHRAAVRNKGA